MHFTPWNVCKKFRFISFSFVEMTKKSFWTCKNHDIWRQKDFDFFSNRFFFVLSREFRVILRWSLSLFFSFFFSFSFSFFSFFFIFCSSKWRNSASTRDLQIWIINWDLYYNKMLDKIKTFSTEHKRYLILVLTCLLLNNVANEFTSKQL